MSQQQKPGNDHPPGIQPGDVYPPTDELTAHQARDAIMSRDAIKPHNHGLDVRETELDGGRHVVTASTGNQVLAQYMVSEPTDAAKTDVFMLGQALEAVARTAGDKPVEKADAAALQAAEARATRQGNVAHGGIGAAAQVAADVNATIEEGEEKVKIGDVLGNATEVLSRDKAATRDDAERVKAAERRNEGEGHLADAVVATAKLNEKMF